MTWGVLCRDATPTDLELMRRAGYGIVWFDLEHGSLSLAQTIGLVRTADHLGLTTAVRIPELTRSVIQPLLDHGTRIVILPDVQGEAHGREFVRLGRFPPLGQRGVSSATRWSGFATGEHVVDRVRTADADVHLMVQFESDEAFASVDGILRVPGVDMVTVGPLDWRLRTRNVSALQTSVSSVLERARDAGKVTAMAISSPAEVRRYRSAGVRILFVGIDIAMKSAMLSETLERFRTADA